MFVVPATNLGTNPQGGNVPILSSEDFKKFKKMKAELQKSVDDGTALCMLCSKRAISVSENGLPFCGPNGCGY